MKPVMTQTEYLKALNNLNQKFGLALKYDPKNGRYILEDLENYDFEEVTLTHDSLTGLPKFEI